MRIRRVGLLLVGLGLLVTPGCLGDLIDACDDELPVASKAFWLGAVIAGTPPVLACAPITYPLSEGVRGWDGLATVLAPGLPTGALGGLALAAPTAVIELLLRFPFAVAERLSERHPARPSPPVPAEPTATRIVTWPAGAFVWLDGDPVGITPLSVVFPDRGTVTVRLGFDGRETKHEVQRTPGSFGAGVGWEPSYEFVLSSPR